ncbi:MAG: glycosyltransferase, partial [bacterium]
MGKTKVAFVASTLVVGGAENVLFNLVTHLPPDKIDSRTYLLREPGPVGVKLIRAGARCEHGLGPKRGDPRILTRLASRFRSFAPQIVFTLDHHNAMFWGRLASLVARVPRRVVVSHSTGRMESAKSFTAVDRLLMRYTDAVVALSAAHTDYLRRVEGIDASKIEVIENGIDIDRFSHAERAAAATLRDELAIGDGEHVVTMVAAIRPEQAHDALLEAAAALAADRADLDLKYLIVGDGPARGDLEAARA